MASAKVVEKEAGAMEQNQHDLRSAHENFSRALESFAKQVLSASNDGREISGLNNTTVMVSTPAGQVIIRDHGTCGVYDSATGTCRMCTPEEAGGAVFKTLPQ